MKILVFGATGKTGKEVVRQAVDLGHAVVAFVRNAERMPIISDTVDVVEGDVMNLRDVDSAMMSGLEAVIGVLGSKGDYKGMPMTIGTRNIITAMNKRGVRRLIVQSSYPMSGSAESMEFLKKIMTEEQIKESEHAIKDKIGQEKEIIGSGLDWTIIRPVFLTEDPKTGKYQFGEKVEVGPDDKVARADVANFELKIIEDVSTYRKIFTIKG